MLLELLEMPITDEIRRELKASLSAERTLYRVAKETGISWGTLNRFIGGGGLISSHIDTLATYLNLGIVRQDAEDQPPARKTTPRKRPTK